VIDRVEREATERDMPALLAIDNDLIATSTAIYMDDPTALGKHCEWSLLADKRTLSVANC
jgi:L-amino acid N-acyltransferase YncA